MDDGIVDCVYKTLAPLQVSFMIIWYLSAIYWTFNTCRNRHFQTTNLRWTLVSVSWFKVLQLTFSVLFWYSCFNTNECTRKMSYEVYVAGVLCHTAMYVLFLLISSGYCVTCHHLSVTKWRTIAIQGSICYSTLTGYRGHVPYFSVIFLLNHVSLFYVIFHNVSQNLILLRNQLSFIDDEDREAMHVVYMKYTIFRKFQGLMRVVAIIELALLVNLDVSVETYWIRLLVREWAQFCIIVYIWWMFMSQELASGFAVTPTISSKLPHIYLLEMTAQEFKEMSRNEWHIGVVTSPDKKSFEDSPVAVIESPHDYRPTCRNLQSQLS